ncbi:MAG TPA: WecB/TagA/CpsF family glycosyltransferase [Blastocatellia bacterium]|nr:WecB/TagA/CpsF family glycosyltransferase [Blastocatellia bacterium]
MKTKPFVTPRANVLGIGVHALNMETAVDAIEQAVAARNKGYVCVTGVHGVIEAQHDAKFKEILNRAFLVTPDGMPTVWVGKTQGHRQMARVYGPDLMIELCRRSLENGTTHFLYGGNDGVAQDLAAELRRRFPGIKIVGVYTPPFRPLTQAEEAELIAQVESARPDLFWVGLSTPKQERFMEAYLGRLNVKVMLGVGAAFDIHTGRTKDAPQWMKRSGLQWLFRLLQEPRRLARRYMVNNPLFIYQTFLQLAGLRNYSVELRGIENQERDNLA